MNFESLGGIRLQSIYGIGRNYAGHAQELGNAVPAEPVVFVKPVSAILDRPREIQIPQNLGRVDHEGEIVLVIGKARSIAGVGVGIDLTARDLQTQLKAKSLPWALAKGRKGFGPISEIVPFDSGRMKLEELGLELWFNGVQRQKAVSSQMVFSIPKQIQFLDEAFGLSEGDLIFTGTPSGVQGLVHGDRVKMVGIFGSQKVIWETEVKRS